MAVVITACSNRKRAPADPKLQARDLSGADAGAVVDLWATRLREARAVAPAWRVYCGRSFQEARAAAASLNGRLAIVSAGLGLVDSDLPIPAYGLTVADGAPDNVLARISPRIDPGAWWRALTAASPYHTPVGSLLDADGPIVVALPSAYLAMIAADLTALSSSERARLRLITGGDARATPAELWEFVLPYDERLSGPDSDRPGTRSDFCSRAARHFAEIVFASDPCGNASQHGAAVSKAMAHWRRPMATARTKKTDAEILDLLRHQWDRAGGSTARLLRLLRDDLGVACEQGRLAKLVHQIRRETVGS